MIIPYQSKNAVEFLNYSAVYVPSEIKNFVRYLYKDYFYALGLEIEGNPAGFIAVERRSDAVHVCQCLYISKKHRKRGYAQALLKAALKKSQEEAIGEFYSSYFEDREWTQTAKTLYNRLDFKLSGYVRNTFVSERLEIKKSIDRMKRKYSRYLNLPEDAIIKRIAGLNLQETERIKMELGTSIPYNFNPLSGTADENASLILFIKEEPVSWMIFEKRGSKLLYINQLYVKEKYRKRGFFFPVICRAFDNTPESIRKYFFYVNGDNVNMLGLLKLFKNSDIKHERMIEMVKVIDDI